MHLEDIGVGAAVGLAFPVAERSVRSLHYSWPTQTIQEQNDIIDNFQAAKHLSKKQKVRVLFWSRFSAPKVVPLCHQQVLQTKALCSVGKSTWAYLFFKEINGCSNEQSLAAAASIIL